MKLPAMLLGAALVAALAFALPIQDSRPAPPQDETAKKIEALTKALDLEVRRATELEARLDRVEAWLLTVRTAAALLDGAADDARRNGFEEAGANPLSRTNVLEGMKAFAAEVQRLLPPLEPAVGAAETESR
jgi:hypothetical protein